MLADYHGRVANVLDEAVQPRLPAPIPTYPRHRDRALQMPDVRVGVSEALQLRPCLGRLIGERNSILGQVMAASTRFSYESRFADAVRQCEQASDVAAIGALDDVRDAKHHALIVAGWNAAFDSASVAEFLSVGATPTRVLADADAIAGLDALQALAGLIDQGLNGDAVPESAIEAVLSRLRQSRGAAEVLAAAALLTARLGDTADLIHARLDRRPVCLQPQPTPTARIAETVFHKFYANGAQPYLANVVRALDRLDAGLAALLAAQRAQPRQAVVDYVDAVHALREDLQRASRHHARAWQRLLRECGRMPGQLQ